jgi:hypothetical protein
MRKCIIQPTLRTLYKCPFVSRVKLHFTPTHAHMLRPLSSFLICFLEVKRHTILFSVEAITVHGVMLAK